VRAPGLRSITLLLIPAFLLATESPGRAQTTGGLRGTVCDEAGLPLEGATVTVSSAAQSVAARVTATDSEGRFQIQSLPPAGDYQVSALYPGFGPVTLTGLEVLSGQATLVRIALQRQSQAYQEHVSVKASPPMVTLQETTGQSRFTSEFIDSLPILGRNYQDLLALAPGVSDVDGDGNPNIHGARDTDVVTLVDGVSTTDPLTGKIGAQLNIESIQEIEVKTSGATAEFSRAQGGFANIITKSGGNDFEGTFKVFYRGSVLDGDGAGIDDPKLHAGLGENGLRNLTFNDILPFLSLGGPIVKDKAWFYVATEYVQIEDPVNALNSAFVAEQKEFRNFAKLTWQAAPNHRLSLSLNYDPQTFYNQGLNSFTREESGYTLNQGGPVLTAKWLGILGPYVSLETSLSSFDERPSRQSTTNPDTNHNGLLWTDRNGNGFGEVTEYDPGEDYDLNDQNEPDGKFDVFESALTGDRDGDHRLTPPGGCEGVSREDLDCDGHLDTINEDDNHNGRLDPGEDRDGDGRLDLGVEDRNHNQRLDDRPSPAQNNAIIADENNQFGNFYPYHEAAPRPPDEAYTINQRSARISGPFYEDFDDSRRRFTFRQDASVFVPDFYGSHDLKMGIVVEKENFDRTTTERPILAPVARKALEGPSTVRTIVPAEGQVANQASSLTGGIYVQDAFKPFPNLSLGIGVRFDREATDSFGYTPFDPREERARFDRINSLLGTELGHDDLTVGNNDGLINAGIRGDPLFNGPEGPNPTLVQMLDPLRIAALKRMTRHHTEAGFLSQELAPLFPEISQGGEVTAEQLSALGIKPQVEEPFRLTNNNLAPRLSVAWDPVADGRTKLFATWGRYYDKLFLSSIVGEEGPDDINRYYLLDPAGVTGQGVPDRQIGQVISKAPPSATQVDRGLQTPWSDEWTLGFERELAPELSLSLTFVARDYRQQLQDIDVNHYTRIDPQTGELSDVLGRLPPSFSPNGVSTDTVQPDFRPDLFINNFFFNQILRVGNYNSARYRGASLELVKRLSRRWEMQGSYTYSRAQGAAEDFQSRLGNDPSTIESEFGYLDFDQRHVLKLNSSFFLPGDWQLGWSIGWASGLPYSVISRFFALDNVGYQQFRTLYGTSVFEPTPAPGKFHFVTEERNDHRNRSTLNIGARARKSFVIGHQTAGIFLEVFNLLNTDDLHIITYEPVPPDISQANTPSAGALQINGTRQFGRRFQVGFQISF
jgi:hypothetical protein